jgi:hypothetical protein
MAQPQDVIMIALYEATAQNGWKSNKNRVKEYIRTSRNVTNVSDDPQSKEMSWCGDFVYWVLFQAGVQPLPGPWHIAPKSQGWTTAISRFTQLYTQVHDPEPGDLYYMPVNAQGYQKDHIGIVYATNEWKHSSCFTSIDGNTDGNLGANWANLVVGIGGGYVAQNRRNSRAVSKPITFYRPPYS